MRNLKYAVHIFKVTDFLKSKASNLNLNVYMGMKMVHFLSETYITFAGIL